MKKICLILCLMLFGTMAHAQCSPFQSLGTTQFFDNSGVPLTNGVLYSFQAGTSTQQATFTDSTCTTQNVNPITFTTGARVNIWLTTGNFYKFQLCLQNDGPTCAAGDVLFSVDNVPGGSSGGGGGGGAPFISTSPNPATSGVLRCASGDQCLAFRNAANSANLAITKDANDILSWAGGAFKLPEIAPPACSAGFDVLWADSTNHTFRSCSNGGSPTTLARGGVDISGPGADHVTSFTFGATSTPLSGTPPTSGQFLQWNGTNIVGTSLAPGVVDLTAQGANIATTTIITPATAGMYQFFCYIVLTRAATTSSTLPGCNLAWTDSDTNTAQTVAVTASSNLNTVGIVVGINGGGTPFVEPVLLNARAATAIQYSTTGFASSGATSMQYAIHVRVVGPF